jgi:hypothetical protein
MAKNLHQAEEPKADEPKPNVPVPDQTPRCWRCGTVLDTTLHSIDAANIAAGALVCQRCILKA